MISSFSGWLLSIVGVVTLGVLIDIILPDGNINKYVKAVFSFFTLFVIISPLSNVSNIDISYGDIFSNSKIELNSDYLESVSQKKIENIKNKIYEDAEKDGITNFNVEILSDLVDYDTKIYCVNIFLENVVISKQDKHINIYEILIDITKTYINIDKELIFFYE